MSVGGRNWEASEGTRVASDCAEHGQQGIREIEVDDRHQIAATSAVRRAARAPHQLRIGPARSACVRRPAGARDHRPVGALLEAL